MLELEERLRRHVNAVIDGVGPVTAEEARARGVGRPHRALWLLTAAAVVLALVVVPFVLADDGGDKADLHVTAEPGPTTTISSAVVDVPALKQTLRQTLEADARCTQPSCETLSGLIGRGDAIEAAVRPLHEELRRDPAYKNDATYTAGFRVAHQALRSCQLLSERKQGGTASDVDCVSAMREYRRAVAYLRDFTGPR